MSVLCFWGCRISSSIYSITKGKCLIHFFYFFVWQTGIVSYCHFRGLCPHPVSGIRLGFSGNNINADGIRLGWRAFSYAAIPVFLQVSRKPFPIQDGQLVQYLVPAPVSLRPFLRYILACQVQHLFQGRVAREHAFCFGHFPILAVQPFYDVRGVHDPADVIRELEERADVLPAVFPVADGKWVFLPPCFLYAFQF